MDNGQYRFRLLKSDGTAYIRTESMLQGAWESSHYHVHVKETYIVQSGWIAYAQFIEGKRRIRTFRAGELFTTEPHIVHNIYMPLGSVIHVIKHGDSKTGDRVQDETTKYFDTLTKSLAEDEIMHEAVKNNEVPSIETRYSSYVETHSTLDKLIWQIPAFLVAVSAVGFGLMGTFLPEEKATIPPFSHTQTLGLLLFFWGAMYLLGCYAMERLRYHHSLVATIIARLDPNGYFDKRLESINRTWPISATSAVKVVFGAFGIILLLWGVVIFRL